MGQNHQRKKDKGKTSKTRVRQDERVATRVSECPVLGQSKPVLGCLVFSFCFYFLAVQLSMQELSSLTRD